jgi:Rad52/22 family double-strand break repair protein
MTITSTIDTSNVKTTRTTSTTAARRPVLQALREADAADRHCLATLRPAGFSPEQINALAAPLDRRHISQREQGRSRVAYLQSWWLIREANRIFGFDGWQRQTLACLCIHQGERLIGRDQKPGWGVTYTARVRITVIAGGQGPLVREGTGAGHGIDSDLGLAHESAIKEAETDAMKRALMTFGNPFGLALYDKQQREVTGGDAEGQSAPAAAVVPGSPSRVVTTRPVSTPAPRPVPAPRPEAPLAPGERPLDATTIEQLQRSIRALPGPVREGFSVAFRRRFQIPAEVSSIADRIVQQCHHDWIEAFLVQQQPRLSQAQTTAAEPVVPA